MPWEASGVSDDACAAAQRPQRGQPAALEPALALVAAHAALGALERARLRSDPPPPAHLVGADDVELAAGAGERRGGDAHRASATGTAVLDASNNSPAVDVPGLH